MNVRLPLRPREAHSAVKYDSFMLQPSLFPLRITHKYPPDPIGTDIAFRCEAGSHGTFYAKDDSSGRPVRATEFVATKFAENVKIAVADCAVLEDENGETFFGSQSHISTAENFVLNGHLRTPKKNELGEPDGWLGMYLSGLYVLDMFLSNDDRWTGNFVLTRDGFTDTLRAIDFGASRLKDISSNRFPVAESRTVRDGRILRKIHTFSLPAAHEMIDRIAAVPESVIDSIFSQLPEDWVSDEHKGWFRGVWVSGVRKIRLSALRAGLNDESLL